MDSAFMQSVIKNVVALTDFFWGWPILLLLMGGGVWIMFQLRFVQFRYFPTIMKETFGKMFSSSVGGEGTVSPFQAASTALASSIGAANIVVAPAIIFMAGPGAVFWMWVAGVIGCSTKFAEVALSIKYRETNTDGDYVGGASYTFKNGIGGVLGKIMGWTVAFFFMLEILPSITLQTLSAAGPIEQLGLSSKVSVVVIFILVSLVVFGGVKRIGQVTEKMVPFMAGLYVIFGLVIIFMHASKVPGALLSIFQGAFNPQSVAGGIVGATLAKAMQKGIARGCYSNEAGMGSAGYGHAAAITDHPARQGMWGIFEVVADTLIVCSISALVVLVTDVWKNPANQNIAIHQAFTAQFGAFGSVLISICLFLFVLSTIIVIVFYAEKQAEFCFGTAVGKIVRVVASLMILLGAFISFEHAGVFLDFTLGLVVFVNMLGMVMMSGKVRAIVDDFFGNPKYFPGKK